MLAVHRSSIASVPVSVRPAARQQRHTSLAWPCPAPISHSRRNAITCQGLFGLGLPEIAVIAGMAALVFGPAKLPELGKSLGKTIKSFQTAAKEFETELKVASESGTPPAEGSIETKVETKQEVKKE